MTKLVMKFPGSFAAPLGYGKAEVLPTFGAGYAAHLLGSAFGVAANENIFNPDLPATLYGAAPGTVGMQSAGALFTGSVSGNTLTVSAVTGTLAAGQRLTYNVASPSQTVTIQSQLTGTTGGDGTYQLSENLGTIASSGMSSWAGLQFQANGQGLFAPNNAVTLLAVVKTPAAQQALLSDNPGGGGGIALLNNGASVQAFESDGSSGSASSLQSYATVDPASNWTLFGGIYTYTGAQAFCQRTATGRLTATTATKASALPGRASVRVAFGRAYVVPPASTAAILCIYTKALSGSELNEWFAAATTLMSGVGATL